MKKAESVAKLLRDARAQTGISQNELAERASTTANLSGPRISSFENGQARPSVFQLVKISKVLGISPLEALFTRLRDEVTDEIQQNGDALWTSDEAEDVLHEFDRLIAGATAKNKQTAKTLHRTLANFPDAYPDLVIVTGDKREDPPKSAGDIGAYSASPIDDRWIHSLGLPHNTEKVSDKEFVVCSKERLRNEYGKCNLLVIGSPASNHLARIVNQRTVFRFNLHKEFYESLQTLVESLRGEKDRPALERQKQDHSNDLKRLMRTFYAYGIVDPLRSDVVGFAIPPDRDYATISLARNPFADEKDYNHVCILVAGFHHPGTAIALKRLGEPAEFVDRPFGGVLEISIDENRPWEDRTRRGAQARWETAAYSKEEVEAGLLGLKAVRGALLSIDHADIDAVVALVKHH